MKKIILFSAVLLFNVSEVKCHPSGNYQTDLSFSNQEISGIGLALNAKSTTSFVDRTYSTNMLTDELENPAEPVNSTQAGNTRIDFGLSAGLSNCIDQNGKAVITDFRYIVRPFLNILTDADTSMYYLLDYFIENEYFTDSMLTTVEKLTKEKFGVSEVIFLQENPIECCFGSDNRELNIEQTDRASADIFVSIVSINTLGMGLKFKLVVENKKGKKIFKQTARILTQSDSLSGTYICVNHDMSDEKFQQLYRLGLSAMFENEKPKLEPHFVTRPVHKEYVDFYSQSICFSLIRGKDNYILEDRQGNIFEPAFFILKGKGKGVRGGWSYNFGLFSSQKYKKYSFLHNFLLNEDYFTLTQGKSPGRLQSKSHGLPDVEFIHKDTIIGHFGLGSDWSFHGEFVETNYSIGRSLKPPFYCISANDNLIAIIRYRPDGHYIINMLNTLTPREQGRLFNVIFGWEEAIRMNNMLEAK